MENLKTENSAKTGASPSPSEAIELLRIQAREIQQQFNEYIAARVAQLKHQVTRIVALALSLLLGFIVLVSLFVTATVVVVQGLSACVSAAFPGHPWLGDVIVGAALLGVLTLGVITAKKKAVSLQLRAAAVRLERKSPLGH